MLRDALKLRRDPLSFLTEVSRQPEDIVPIKLGFQTLFLLNHPDHIRHIFRENDRNYIKGHFYRRISAFTGDGMFTVEGVEWSRQRHLAQPFFSGQAFKSFAPNIARVGRRFMTKLATDIQQGEKAPEQELLRLFSALTFEIAIDCFYGSSSMSDVEESDTFSDTLSDIMRFLEHRLWRSIAAPMWLPTGSNRRFKKARQHFNRFLDEQMAKRLADPTDGSRDLLIDGILKAEGGATRAAREQLLSILIAAFETSSLALLWSVVLVKQHPHLEDALREEASAVFKKHDNKAFTQQAVQDLILAKQVFNEALRLYPPAWCFSRELLAADTFGAHTLPAGATVMICPYTIQRHPDFWDDPDDFRPSRFQPDGEANQNHSFAYFPFAGGRHACLGARFALTEGPLMLSMLLNSFYLDLKDKIPPKPTAATTLRPMRDIMAHIQPINPR